MAETCPTCGCPVVVSGDEGTSHYTSLYHFDAAVPLAELREENDRLAAALKTDIAEADRLRAALEEIARGAAACERCGVTYSDYRGRCQELIGTREPFTQCTGYVSSQGLARAALDPKLHLWELEKFRRHSSSFGVSGLPPRCLSWWHARSEFLACHQYLTIQLQREAA